MDLGTLVGKLAMDPTGWTTGFNDAEGVAKKFGQNVPTWMGIASGAIIAGGIAAVAGLYKVGEVFDDVEDTIRVNTGAVGDDLDGLVESAKRVGSNVPAEFSAIAPALSDVRQRLGLTGDTLETVTGQFLEAGRILGEEVDIGAATGALNAFHIEGDAVSGSLDFLFQQAQRSGIGMNDLIAKVQSAAPITQQLGFSFEETAGMIASFDKAGLDSQNMIGAMQKGLVNLQSPGETAEDAFKRVTGEIGSFLEAGNTVAAYDLAGQVFGTRGAAQFIGALESGALNMDDLAASSQLTGDSILGAGQETMDFAEKWQLVQNKAMAALEPLGSAVFSQLGEALDYMMPGLDAVTGWLTENPAAIQIIAAVLGVLALAFVGVTVATWAMNTALLANPITWIVLAVVALIAAIILLAMNWDAVVLWISEVWSGFITWITEVITGFESWWMELWAGVGQFFTDVWNGFIGWVTGLWDGFLSWAMGVALGFLNAWNATWAAIGQFFTDLWDGIVSWVTGVWSGFVNWIVAGVIAWAIWWRGVWNGISQFFADLWGGIVGFVTDAWNNVVTFLSGIPQAILDVFAGAGEWLYNIGRDILEGLWDGLKSIWNGLVGWITDIGEDIAGTFADVLGIRSPSRVFRSFGLNIGEGLLEGLREIQPEIDATMGGLVDPPSSGDASAISDSYNTRGDTSATIIVSSVSEAEELFDLLDSGRPA